MRVRIGKKSLSKRNKTKEKKEDGKSVLGANKKKWKRCFFVQDNFFIFNPGNLHMEQGNIQFEMETLFCVGSA